MLNNWWWVQVSLQGKRTPALGNLSLAPRVAAPGRTQRWAEAAMKTCWFVVIFSNETWWIDCEGKSYGPFEDQRAAEEDAVRLAEAFGDPSRRSLVYAPDELGTLRLLWSEAQPPS